MEREPPTVGGGTWQPGEGEVGGDPARDGEEEEEEESPSLVRRLQPGGHWRGMDGEMLKSGHIYSPFSLGGACVPVGGGRKAELYPPPPASFATV